jgi:hypothetical protein
MSQLRKSSRLVGHPSHLGFRPSHQRPFILDLPLGRRLTLAIPIPLTVSVARFFILPQAPQRSVHTVLVTKGRPHEEFVMRHRTLRRPSRLCRHLGRLSIASTHSGRCSCCGHRPDVHQPERTTSGQFLPVRERCVARSNEIAADRTADSVSAELGNKTQAAVRALIEDAAANEHAKPGTDLQKVRDLYRSHMDAVRIDPIRKHVDRAGASTNRPSAA